MTGRKGKPADRTIATAGPDDEAHRAHLRRAIDEATAHCQAGHGGPFGAVVVKDGQVVGVGWNEVTSRNDPTAHAEVQAIRAACAALGSFQLDGCDVYASCEPCPMCLGALYWARPRAVYYAASRHEAADAGFDDAFIYEELARPIDQRNLPLRQVSVPEARQPFEAWLAIVERIRY
jgi:tRNA(Arg) A34 adenosine deaminase TadA